MQRAASQATAPTVRRGEAATPEPVSSVSYYAEHHDAIAGACLELLAGASERARATLERFRLRYVDQWTSNGDLLAHLTAESLLQRFDCCLLSNANVYVQFLDVPQTTLFYLMAQAVPFVDASHRIANHYIVAGLADAKHATLLDLGVGCGRQLELLLRRLDAESPALERLLVIGVDPVGENLLAAKRVVRSLRPKLHFGVDYRPVLRMIENDIVSDLPPMDDGKLFINSAFTFHHTRHVPNDTQARTQLLRQLAALVPAVFTLAEPSSNHDTEDVIDRLYASWNHFSHLFELVDTALLKPNQRFAIKAHFFGREIRDLFAIDDHVRCERHEPWQAWRTHLRDSGLVPLPIEDLSLELPKDCSLQTSRDCVRLAFRDTDLCAVFGYTPGDGNAGDGSHV